ncbi:AMP-binding protein [Pseudoscardovia radai]|uniref:Acyl-CoA synthetase n=1 Tax=Pseudoscardovia radai TaxID=987066 RepID=A0A261EX97_9BIFI|nr:AMP-binding protein [Pseudoscardovia radai]
MTFFQSIKSSVAGVAQRAHRLGKYSDTDTPDYDEDVTPTSAIDTSKLPYEAWWSKDYPTTTYIDEKTGLLTSRTEGVDSIDDDATVYTLYEDRARRMPDDPLFSYKKDGQWVTMTAAETLADIRRVAKGLIHIGLEKGDAIAFMCHTSYEWDVFDAAALAVGAVIATVYDTDSAEQIRNIANNSDARAVVVETRDMAAKCEGIEEDCPTVRRVGCFENGDLDALRAYGDAIDDATLDARIASIHKTDLCSIVYTSGSTAAPKGVEMTHEHYLQLAYNLQAFIPDIVNDPDGSILMFLPQAHTFARAINYGVVGAQMHVYIATGIKTLLSDLQVARPTALIVVPRVLEKVYNAASQKAGRGPKGLVFASAVETARKYMRQVAANGHASPVTAAHRAMYEQIVYSQLKSALGGRIKWLVCGGAPLDPELMTFYRGAGIPVYEGYGLTETTAPCAFAPLGTPFRAGSVGVAFPGFSVRLSEEGEIQLKGRSVFKRYHKNDEATASSFTKDGWYATGDLGRLDVDGFLYITGRKKDLIITAGGKNVSPTPIEEAIQRCSIVSHALVLGDKRPFISALITLDTDVLGDWLEANGLNRSMPMEEACTNGAVRAEVQKYVDLANEGVSRAESVRKFIIVPEDFTQENGLMTASMKVIRPKVLRRYSRLLDTQMYVPRK